MVVKKDRFRKKNNCMRCVNNASVFGEHTMHDYNSMLSSSSYDDMVFSFLLVLR